MVYNPNCDGYHCMDEHGGVKRLSLRQGAGMFLCCDCFKYEMDWRKLRNETLVGDCKFDIIEWDSLPFAERG